MKSISQNKSRYLPYELKTRIHAVETYRNGNSISYVCRKYHISRISLWRWNKKYNGTPTMLGKKLQIDVKYVPNECKVKGIPDDIRFSQYTYVLMKPHVNDIFTGTLNTHQIILYILLKNVSNIMTIKLK